MSNEQNLDDILELLKNAVSTQEADNSTQPYFAEEKEVTNEELEKQLKEQYLGGTPSESVSSYEPVKEYVISDEFLSEIEDKEEEPVEVEEIEEEIEEIEEIEEAEEIEEEILIEETVEPNEEEPWTEEAEETISVSEEESEEQINSLSEEQTEQEPMTEEEYFELGRETDGEDEYDDLVFNNDEPEELIISEEDVISEETAPEEEEKPKVNRHHETFLASMRKTGMEFTTEELHRADALKSEKITVEDAVEEEAEEFIQEPEMIEIPVFDQTVETDLEEQTEESSEDDLPMDTQEEELGSEELDMSTVNIMMQFCEKEELEDTIGNEAVEDFLMFEQTHDVPHQICDEALGGVEYISESQNQAIYDSYKRSTSGSLLMTVGCGILSLIAIIYDLLPIAGTQIGGFLNYITYPVVYALVGLQFVVFVAAICYKKIWEGFKRAFSLRPNTYSVIAVILSLTALYDVIVAVVLACSGDELPMMYNGVATFITTLVLLSEYFDLYAESRVFNVYSNPSNKFTLTGEDQKTPVGQKLYSGGVELSKKIYSAHSLEFPRGFFRGLNVSEKKYSLLTMSLIPVIILGMVASVVSVVMGTDAYASCGAFMVALYAILPITLLLSDSMQNFIATLKLTSSGSAYAGQNAIKNYSDCDVLVFKDSHLFKQIRTEDVGFAIYDNNVGYLALGCFDSLVRYVGGPLSGIKLDKIPDAYKFDKVQINRMARNGIDATVENRYSVLVGDYEFMKRYGLSFPENETDNGRSTLCVALNGKAVAKLSVKYSTEPVFEMLVERLNAEGVSVAITTADPLISSKTVTDNRTIGSSPISVIHKSVDEFGEKKKSNYREDTDGVVACQSRLKLAAVVVWLKRLRRLRKVNRVLAIGFSVIGTAALVMLVINGAMGYVNPLYVLAYLLLELGAAIGVTVAMTPHKNYFTVERLYEELEKLHMKEQQKAQKKLSKQKK